MQKHSKTKLPCLIAFYDTQPGNEVGLFYNVPEPTWEPHNSTFSTYVMESRKNITGRSDQINVSLHSVTKMPREI